MKDIGLNENIYVVRSCPQYVVLPQEIVHLVKVQRVLGVLEGLVVMFCSSAKIREVTSKVVTFSASTKHQKPAFWHDSPCADVNETVLVRAANHKSNKCHLTCLIGSS